MTVGRILREIAAIIIIAGLASASRAAPPQSDRPTELINSLRNGGYVLVMRHADSPATLPDKASAAPGNVRLERQLSENGRMAAEKIGRAIEALRIPISEIYTSPTFRAMETARLLRVAGTLKPVAELAEGEQGMADDADATRATWLKHASTVLPRVVTNTLIITHTPNLRAAFGTEAQGIAAGESMVFRPDGRGSSSFVGRIRPEDWFALAPPK